MHYFEWRTNAACKKDTFKANKEVTRALQGYVLVMYILGALRFEIHKPFRVEISFSFQTSLSSDIM